MISIERAAAPAEVRRPAKRPGDGPPMDPRTAQGPHPATEPGHTVFDDVRQRPGRPEEPALHEALFGMYYLG